jgi:hypothetical protein
MILNKIIKYNMTILSFLLAGIGVHGQSSQMCQLKFDFGYGEGNYCDSSLIKAGYFNYNGLVIRQIHIIKEIKWIHTTYADSDIEMKFQNANICIRKNTRDKFQIFNLLKLYESDVTKKNTFSSKLLLNNGYKFELGGKKYYLFFIRAKIGSASIVRYKCILFDLSSPLIKVVPFPGFQSSTSAKCLGQLYGNEELDYISFNVFTQSNPAVLLYRYRKKEFIKDMNYRLSLVPQENGQLYKIDWAKSKWPKSR